MTLRKRALAIAALGLCCFAFTGAAPPPAGDRAPKHFLWKVTGPKAVVYLLGTIHAAKADLYPLPAIIEDSFEKADKLIEEIDISERAEAERAQRRLIKMAAIRTATQLPIISAKQLAHTSRRI